jgi:hypothetical protein
MLQHGRVFEFAGEDCSVRKLRNVIESRRTVAYWSQITVWNWPQDDREKANESLWQIERDGGRIMSFAVRPGVKPHEALRDVLVNNKNYVMGCFNAARILMSGGVFDSFAQRISQNSGKSKSAEVDLDIQTLNKLDQVAQGAAIEEIEPEISDGEVVKQGKYLDMHFNVPGNNWVPGDWGYIRNTEEVSHGIFGFEGHNFIYLGRGQFTDYYDSTPERTLDYALLDVYAWRKSVKPRSQNGEMSESGPSTLENPDLMVDEDLAMKIAGDLYSLLRSSAVDNPKVQDAQRLIQGLRRDPREGGILRDVRSFPKPF